MRILLDESLPRKLKRDFPPGHEIFTVRDKGWLGMKNGVLLNLMVENGFELFVTVDRSLPYQQNTQRLPLIVVVLCAVNNRLETLRELLPKMFERLSAGNIPPVVEVY